MATLTATTVETYYNSIVIKWQFSGGDGNYDNYRFLDVTINGIYKTTKLQSDSIGGTSSTWTTTLTSVASNSTYTCVGTVFFSDASGYQSSGVTLNYQFRTNDDSPVYPDPEPEPEPDEPEPEPEISIDYWNWYESNGLATKEETIKFKSMLEGTVKIEDGFYANVWNDIVNKIEEIIYKTGHEWEGSVWSSKCDSGDYFTAVMYNGVVNNVNKYYGSGNLSEVESGDYILTNIFEKLTDIINNWIDTL